MTEISGYADEGAMTKADYEADRAEAYLEEQAELDAERRSYEEGREPPPEPPRVLATFTPNAAAGIECELLDDETVGLVLRVEFADGGNGHAVSGHIVLAGFADVLIGPLLDQLRRDYWGLPARLRIAEFDTRLDVVRGVLAPVLERPTDPDPPDPDPF